MIYGNAVGGSGLQKTITLVDEDGNEVTAVLVGNETVFDATENDIRLGKKAATEKGVTVGTKVIPSYHTTEGMTRIAPGKPLKIPMYSDEAKYTKLQAIICEYNTNSENSVAAQMVAINDRVYDVQSTAEKTAVSVDEDAQTINFGLTNDSDGYLVIRYFMYREEE